MECQIDISDQASEFLALHWDEYFYCERERCLMKKTQCLKNKLISSGKMRWPVHGLDQRFYACDRATCWGCEQGERIAAEIGENGETGRKKLWVSDGEKGA